MRRSIRSRRWFKSHNTATTPYLVTVGVVDGKVFDNSVNASWNCFSASAASFWALFAAPLQHDGVAASHQLVDALFLVALVSQSCGHRLKIVRSKDEQWITSGNSD